DHHRRNREQEEERRTEKAELLRGELQLVHDRHAGEADHDLIGEIHHHVEKEQERDAPRALRRRRCRHGGSFALPPSGPAVAAVAGETIVAVAAPGALSAQTGGREIDAAGHSVLPGGIDPHVHMQHTWMLPGGVPLTTAGPTQVGRAALHGGTTTLIDFAYW